MLRIKISKTGNIIIKVASFILSMVFLLSAIMTVTYAWENYAQHKTNEVSIVPPHIRVVLNKYEKDADGNVTAQKIEGAQFDLYQVTENGDERIGGIYTSDKNGQIILHDKLRGDFYFLEIKPGYGYTYDNDSNGEVRKYYFSIDGTETETTINVSAYNKKMNSGLVITKTVANADSSVLTEEQLNTQFEFTVNFNDAGEYDYSIDNALAGKIKSGDKIYLKHGQTAEIHNLPVGISYEIVETQAEGFTVSGKNQNGNITKEGITAEFINTFDKPEEVKTSLSVTKIVGGDAANQEKEFEFEITFSDGGEYEILLDEIVIAKTENGTARFKLKHGQTAVLPNLPKGIEYSVTEIDANTDDYISSTDNYVGITSENEINLPFYNYKSSGIEEKGKLVFGKAVTGENADEEKLFDFTVEFSLEDEFKYSVNGEEKGVIKSGEIISLKHNDKVEILDLPVGVTYKITEKNYAEEGYTANYNEVTGKIIGKEEIIVSFVNNKEPEKPQEKEEVLVVKKVVEGEVNEKDKEKQFGFTVIINSPDLGEQLVYEFSLKAGEEKEFPLPPNAVFEVSEADYSKDGFIKASSQTNYEKDGKHYYEVTYVNTYVGIINTYISGEKLWDLSADNSINLPSKVVIYLMDGNIKVDEVTVTPDENGRWFYSFTAPKYRDDGTEILYTVTEEPIESFVQTNLDNFGILNTYVKPVTEEFAQVSKVIKGDKPENESEFNFTMRAINGAPMPDGSNSGEKTISISGEGTASFGEITYTSEGVYEYKITETVGRVPWYTYDKSVYILKVEVKMINGVLSVVSKEYIKDNINVESADFINEYTKNVPKDKKITISGRKIWNHGTNKNIPKSVTIHILADGKKLQTFKVDAESHWRWSYELPQFDLEGREIVYTVDESAVSGYTKKVDGYDIINTHKSVPNGSGGNSQTGDSVNLSLWLWLMVISAVMLKVLLSFKVKAERGYKYSA